MKKMHRLYDEQMASLGITYKEEYISTSFGKTHIITAGDESKPKIFTVHGGNGITPINLRLFAPLLEKYCIIAPDVVGMPGKSAPYRNLDTNRDDFGLWLCEVLDALGIDSIPFVVSSYSSAMLLSLAEVAPDRIAKAIFVVPSGFAHGPLMRIIRTMTIPMMKYYFAPSEKTMNGIMALMSSQDDVQTSRFFDLMMSSYKMEMRPPREFKKEQLKRFHAPVMIFASDEDIFFPAYRVFPQAVRILPEKPQLCRIRGNHLPSEKTMASVCRRIERFFGE